jgi:hypothetical protein
MPVSEKDQGSVEVDKYFAGLDHPKKELAAELRRVILSASHGINEHIKWNSPSFAYGGDDRITFNMRSPQEVRIIFHRGAKKNANGSGHFFKDDSGLIKWLGEDRGMVTFADGEQLPAKRDIFIELVRRWVETG